MQPIPVGEESCSAMTASFTPTTVTLAGHQRHLMDLITCGTAVHESLWPTNESTLFALSAAAEDRRANFAALFFSLLVTPAAGIGVLMRRPSHPTETVLPQVLSLEDSLGPEGPQDGEAERECNLELFCSCDARDRVLVLASRPPRLRRRPVRTE